MALRNNRVIIFGATGEVGSAAALEAHSRGAEVWLAMRDVTKTNDWLSPNVEKKCKFMRTQADLADVDSIKAAVQQSAAQAALIYSVKSKDHMRSTVSAMKDAGIQYIVFLSTNGIRRALKGSRDLRSITPDFFVPWKHAQVELALEDLGMPHTAVRPGFFASNPFRMYLHKVPGEANAHARVIAQDVSVDPTDTQDIGRVCGALLVRPSLAKDYKPGVKSVVTLTGPRLITQREQWRIINKTLALAGKPGVYVTEVGAEEYAANLSAQHGVPKPIAESLARSMGDKFEHANESDYDETTGNIERVTGRLPTSFEDFVQREVWRYV